MSLWDYFCKRVHELVYISTSFIIQGHGCCVLPKKGNYSLVKKCSKGFASKIFFRARFVYAQQYVR